MSILDDLTTQKASIQTTADGYIASTTAAIAQISLSKGVESDK